MWLRRLLAPLLPLVTVFFLAACGGGGEESGGDNTAERPSVVLPEVPAQAASAPLGTGGGSTRATLQGGTTVRFEAGAEQRLAASSVAIQPLQRERGSEVGRFRLIIDGGLPQKDALLEIALDLRVQPLSGTRLMLKVGTAWLPISAPMTDSRTLRVALKDVVALALSKANLREPAAATRTKGRQQIQQDREDPPSRILLPTVIELEMTVEGLSDNEVAAALQGAMATAFAPNLIRPDAHLLIRVFDAVIGTLPANDPVLNGAARQFRDAVCPLAAAAVQEMRDDEGTWAVAFEDHMVEATKWMLITTELRTLFAPLVPLVASCENTPLDFTAPAQAAVDDFKLRHERTLETIVKFERDGALELLAVRVPQLLDLEAAIQTLTINATVLPMVEAQLHRVREGAWFACSHTGQQDIHEMLLLKLQFDPIVATAAPFTRETILDEVETCGLHLQIARHDERGEAQYGEDSLLIHPYDEPARGTPASSRRASFNTGNAAVLEIPQSIGYAMGCPAPMSRSAEVLVIEAVPAAGPPTVLLRQSAAGDGQYVLAEPLLLQVDRLREIAGPENSSIVLRVKREGVGCPGAFPGLGAHTPLAEVTIFFNGLTITNTSLPAAMPGQLYQQVMRAEGGRAPYEWSASGLPAELSLLPTTGVLTGTPTRDGRYDVLLRVTDADGLVKTKTLPLRVGVDPRIGVWRGTIEFSASRRFAGTPPVGANRWASDLGGTLQVEMTGFGAANDPATLGVMGARVLGGQDTVDFDGMAATINSSGSGVRPMRVEFCRSDGVSTFFSPKATQDGIILFLQVGVIVVYQFQDDHSCATRDQGRVTSSGRGEGFNIGVPVEGNQMVGAREWQVPHSPQGGTATFRMSWNLQRQ